MSRFEFLANGLASVDSRPTDQQLRVQTWLAGRLRERAASFDTLATKDFAAFNDLPRSRGIAHVVAK